MAVKGDAKHVPHFTLHPVRADPQGRDGGDSQLRLIQHHADRQPLVVLSAREQIHQAKAVSSAAIIQIVHAGDVDQQIKAVVVLEQCHHLGQPVRRNPDPMLPAVFGRLGLKLRL